MSEYVWVPDDHWCPALPEDVEYYRCRWGAGMGHRACGGKVEAYVMRPDRRGGYQRWYYCGRHLYGRRVENGQVWGRVWQGSVSSEEIKHDA